MQINSYSASMICQMQPLCFSQALHKFWHFIEWNRQHFLAGWVYWHENENLISKCREIAEISRRPIFPAICTTDITCRFQEVRARNGHYGALWEKHENVTAKRQLEQKWLFPIKIEEKILDQAAVWEKIIKSVPHTSLVLYWSRTEWNAWWYSGSFLYELRLIFILFMSCQNEYCSCLVNLL